MIDRRPRTLLSVFTSFGVGGAQIRFTAVANRFARRYRHILVAMDGATAACERLDAGLDVAFPVVPVRRGATLGNLPAFRRALCALRPDVLVTHNWGSIEWAIANLPGSRATFTSRTGSGRRSANASFPAAC